MVSWFDINGAVEEQVVRINLGLTNIAVWGWFALKQVFVSQASVANPKTIKCYLILSWFQTSEFETTRFSVNERSLFEVGVFVQESRYCWCIVCLIIRLISCTTMFLDWGMLSEQSGFFCCYISYFISCNSCMTGNPEKNNITTPGSDTFPQNWFSYLKFFTHTLHFHNQLIIVFKHFL